MANRKWRSTRHLTICKLCNVAFEYNTASWTPISSTSSLLSRNKSCDQELYKKRNFLSKFLPAIACRPPHPEKCQLIPTQEDVVDVAVHMCPLWISPTKRCNTEDFVWQMWPALSMHIFGEMTNTLLLSMFWIPTTGWFLFSHRDTTATFNISTCQLPPLHAQISRVGCQLSWPGPMSPPCNWPCPLCRYVYRYKWIHIYENILKRQKAKTLTNVIVLVGVSVLSANLAPYPWICPLFREHCVEKQPD